ncbi:MAG: sigma-54-dependent Fis family transcriptional regulator, partial [Myxococcota bacterium]
MSDSTRCVAGLHLRVNADEAQVASHRLIVTVTQGPDRGVAHEVEATRVSVGSAASADLTLSDDSVSGLHCDIVFQAGHWSVRDLGSTNGTRVRDVWIREAFVESGERIRVGETELLFEGHTEWHAAPPSKTGAFGELHGESAAMRTLFGVLERVAPTNLGVLLVGDTGTGKELAARSIHAASPRSASPLVVVDCGAVTHTLVESHLFGHERGAFTGATKDRPGAVERADGGTILLDEIGELPLELQPKLLRVLERRSILPLGGTAEREVDVRVVAATHRN